MHAILTPFRRGTEAFWIFGLALLVRLGFLAATRHDPLVQTPMLDAEYLVEWARQIQAGDFWGSPEGTAYFRTPLYAWFLALAFALPGPDVLTAQILQAILGAAAAGWLTSLTRTWHGRTAAWVTGLLTATAWPLLLFGRELLIAPLTVFAGVVILAAWARAWRTPTPARFALLGIAIGLACLLRPNFLLTAPLALLTALFAADSRRFIRSLALAAGIAACVLPITVRNHAASGEWILLSYQAGLNLWIGNHPGADGMSATLPGFTAWRNEDVEALLIRELGRPASPREQDAHFRALALDSFRANPGATLAGLFKKTYLFLQGYEIRNNRDLYALRERAGFLRGPWPDWGWILPLALLGLWAERRRLRALVPISAYAIALAAGPILFFVCARYRLPAWPAFLMLAGAGGAALVRPAPVAVRALQVGALALLVFLTTIDPLGIRSPDQSQVHLQLGNVLARRGDPAGAEAAFRDALATAPELAEARHHLGALLLREGRVREAVPLVEAAAAARPESFRIQRTLAETYEAAGNFPGALALRQRVVELHPGDLEARAALATTLGMNGHYRESWEQFAELRGTALERDPSFLLNAGQSALAYKKEDQGVEWLRAATKFPDARADAYEAIARYYLSLRRWDDGLRVLSEGLLREPDSISMHGLRARARHASGDATGAIEDWREVLRLRPGEKTATQELEGLLKSTDSGS